MIFSLISTILLIMLCFIPRRRNNKDNYEKIVAFSNTLVVLISVVSGHVFFSSMGGLFVALTNARIYERNLFK